MVVVVAAGAARQATLMAALLAPAAALGAARGVRAPFALGRSLLLLRPSHSSTCSRGDVSAGEGSLTFLTAPNRGSRAFSSGSNGRVGPQLEGDGVRRERMLLRDYIMRQLYDTQEGYFERQSDAVGSLETPVDFSRLWGRGGYLRLLSTLYASKVR